MTTKKIYRLAKEYKYHLIALGFCLGYWLSKAKKGL